MLGKFPLSVIETAVERGRLQAVGFKGHRIRRKETVISRAVRNALGVIGTLYLAAIATASAAVPENVAYVSTPAGVTVIDLARLEPIKEIDVGGKGPRGLAITR